LLPTRKLTFWINIRNILSCAARLVHRNVQKIVFRWSFQSSFILWGGYCPSSVLKPPPQTVRFAFLVLHTRYSTYRFSTIDNVPLAHFLCCLYLLRMLPVSHVSTGDEMSWGTMPKEFIEMWNRFITIPKRDGFLSDASGSDIKAVA